jgi:hypothetical protein
MRKFGEMLLQVGFAMWEAGMKMLEQPPSIDPM